MSKQSDPKPTEEHRRPYVYYSFEEWGRGYIGVRTRKGCHPGDDYLGSFRDPTFHPVNKIILFEGTAEECLEVEMKLHDFFDVVENPHFANRARQTSVGFSTQGVTWDEDYKEKQSLAQTGKVRTSEQCETISRATTGKKKHLKPGSVWGSQKPEVAAVKRLVMKSPEKAEQVEKFRLSGTAAAAKKPRTQRQLDASSEIGKRPKSPETRRRMSEAAKKRKRRGPG